MKTAHDYAQQALRIAERVTDDVIRSVFGRAMKANAHTSLMLCTAPQTRRAEQDAHAGAAGGRKAGAAMRARAQSGRHGARAMLLARRVANITRGAI